MSRIRMAAGSFVELLGQRCFISRFVLLLAMALLAPLTLLHAQTTYEGNASANAIEGTAVSEACSGCLNGTRIGNIGNGNANYLRIKNISVPTTGTYTVTLYYTEGSDGGARSFTIQINNGAGPTLSNLTGSSWTTPAAPVTFQANFTAGSGNSVGFFNATGSAPDVDHIVVSSTTSGGGGGTTSSPLLIGYVPDYNGSYSTYATSINFSKMTHLNLAFGNPPTCSGGCTASSNMSFSLGQSDSAIAALVNAAHAAGVKVLLSIGGGGGDQQIIQFYNVGLSTQLVNSLATYLTAHNLDGVDVDIEDPNNMGTPYGTFVSALVSKFRPQGKVISAAVAEYLQSAMPDSALHQFDFVNVMVYSNLSDAQAGLQYYAVTKSVPKNQITLGVPFFGQSSDGNTEEEYNTILAAYPNAWQSDEVSGGSLDGGEALFYVGESTMAQETQLGAQYGGVMIWELTGDAPAPHSLLTVVQNNL
ncbi:glycosyl hydrolase family 18 protein [Granulicella mallensis]|uniref:chitinase n=1 Tax=Granulicella mallensis (strain ATCC BAA-1857 / DSM 23137 / MP5ACTX8) TaxID=682795 RepID=G8NPM7_GRAMM|nr:glycosyl hydrolase family 18 protein [Granulicella mallensis]AEU36039.1 glycoside hydrolase family 18 [Granulicella mallensis MP5ACTX8]